jgi:uncharacterized protein
MTPVTAFVARRPVLSYFALTFAVSWGGVLTIIGGPAGFRGAMAQDDPRFPFVLAAMLLGPSLTGILLTIVLRGKAGLRELLHRLGKWRVGVHWYAVALLTAPLVATVAGLLLLRFSPAFRPHLFVSNARPALLLFGMAVALGAGLFEEAGWTGFAVPELRLRFGVIASGLIVGALWSAWHILVVAWGVGSRTGTLPLGVFVALDCFSFLPAFRVLMTWVYDRTGSLLVAMLMHASLTATTLILWPSTAGLPLVVYDFLFAATVWVVIAATPLVMPALASSPGPSPTPRARFPRPARVSASRRPG